LSIETKDGSSVRAAPDQGGRVLIVADDLTGAMDAAGPFATRGMSTWVVALPEACEPARFPRADVIAVNTDSRHLPAAEAAKRVEQAFALIGGERFGLVVKKIDSTLRGNIVAETEALMRASGRATALVCPAFPAQGRVVRGGVVHVHGTPLDQTAFARDSLSPALPGLLHQAFQVPSRHVGVAALRAELVDVPGVFVIDAESDQDLDVVAGMGGSRPQQVLLVGAAGLTAALAARIAPGTARSESPAVLGKIVYVIGSRSSVSREQAEALLADGAKLVEAVNGRLRREPVLTPGADVVLVSVSDTQGREGDSSEVATMLARHAMRLAGPGNAQAVVATGGDTALAFLRTSGNPAVCVGGELMAGIVYARFMMGSRPVWLVTKAGGFGAADTLRRIGRLMRASSSAGNPDT
jgi:uncharacterized protein YgbK (DUF1537 family)